MQYSWLQELIHLLHFKSMKKIEVILIFKYILYVIDTAKFNLVWYIWWLGSDIRIWDNCSWKAYKRNVESR